MLEDGDLISPSFLLLYSYQASQFPTQIKKKSAIKTHKSHGVVHQLPMRSQWECEFRCKYGINSVEDENKTRKISRLDPKFLDKVGIFRIILIDLIDCA